MVRVRVRVRVRGEYAPITATIGSVHVSKVTACRVGVIAREIWGRYGGDIGEI
jgi:hypothetical protein